jgi:hypothetical protein
MSSGWAIHTPLHDVGPGAEAPGPRVMGSQHHLPTDSSACLFRTCRHSRLAVRGSHKRDRRPPHVRWRLRCPPQNSETVLTAGDPTVLGPPFPLLPFLWVPCYLPASEPHANFTAPHAYGESSCIRLSPELASALPASALTWSYAKVLSCTALLKYCLTEVLAMMLCHRRAERATKRSGPCLTLGLMSSASSTISAVNERNSNQPRRECLVPPA